MKAKLQFEEFANFTSHQIQTKPRVQKEGNKRGQFARWRGLFARAEGKSRTVLASITQHNCLALLLVRNKPRRNYTKHTTVPALLPWLETTNVYISVAQKEKKTQDHTQIVSFLFFFFPEIKKQTKDSEKTTQKYISTEIGMNDLSLL